MKDHEVTLISVHIGTRDDMSKQPCESANAELDGFVAQRSMYPVSNRFPV